MTTASKKPPITTNINVNNPVMLLKVLSESEKITNRDIKALTYVNNIIINDTFRSKNLNKENATAIKKVQITRPMIYYINK